MGDNVGGASDAGFRGFGDQGGMRSGADYPSGRIPPACLGEAPEAA